jgi:hypothetical protein
MKVSFFNNPALPQIIRITHPTNIYPLLFVHDPLWDREIYRIWSNPYFESKGRHMHICNVKHICHMGRMMISSSLHLASVHVMSGMNESVLALMLGIYILLIWTLKKAYDFNRQLQDNGERF